MRRRETLMVFDFIGIVVIILVMASFFAMGKLIMVNTAVDKMEEATEYAKKSVPDYLYSREIQSGALDYYKAFDCDSVVIKSADYTIDGKDIIYEFEVEWNQNTEGNSTVSIYYIIHIEYRESGFALTGIEETGSSSVLSTGN